MAQLNECGARSTKPEQPSSPSGPSHGPCVVCGSEGRACARCRVDFYCGKEHQTADWARHKLGCSSLEVRDDPLLGRHLVAAKDIPSGTVLIKELPLITFPTSWSFPVDKETPFGMCVGCGTKVTPDAVAQCGPCGWPVCRRACAERKEHQAECAAFQRAGFQLKRGEAQSVGSVRMNALVALRVCLAFELPGVGPRLRALPAKMPGVAAVQDAGAYRKAVSKGQSDFQETVRSSVAWLRDTARITWLPEEDLMHGLAVALLHGMESPSGSEFYLVGSVFAGLSLVGHSCLPNSWRYASQRSGTEMVLVASRDVPRGARLATAFVRDPLDPAMACERHRRRTLLAKKWGFLCRCELCEDPTQLGLRLDSWHCACWQHPECHCLVLVVDGVRWICDSCGCDGPVSAHDGEALAAGMADKILGRSQTKLYGGESKDGRALLGGAALDGAQGAGNVLLLEEHFRSLVASGSTSIAEWEEFITDALHPSGPAHATHHLVLRAKRQILCPDKTGQERDIQDLKLRIPKTPDEARLVAKHGHDLLRAVEALRPGVNHYRADVLRQLAVLAVTRIAFFAGQQPRQWDARRAEWKTIVEDAVEVIRDLKKISISPCELEVLHNLLSQKNMIFQSLHPVLKKDAAQLGSI